jgi:ribosomal protein L40E
MSTVSPGEYDTLHRFIAHTAICRSCTARDGTTAGIRGCAAGHLLAVRAGLVVRRLMRDGIITRHDAAGDK